MRQPYRGSTADPGKDHTSDRAGMKNPAQAMLITDDTVDSAISEYRPLLVIVGFTDSCGYCRLFNVTISELSRGFRADSLRNDKHAREQ